MSGSSPLEDRTLELPDPASLAPLPGPAQLPGARQPVGRRLFVLSGEQAWALGRDATGIHGIGVGGIRIFPEPPPVSVPATAVRVESGALVRILPQGDAVLVERVLVPRDVPAVVMQWSVGEGSGSAFVELALRVEGDGRGGPTRYHARGGVLRLQGGPDRWNVVVLTDPAAARLSVESGGPGGGGLTVGLRLRIEGERPARVALAGGVGPFRRCLDALGRLRHLNALVRVRERTLEEGRDEFLSLREADPGETEPASPGPRDPGGAPGPGDVGRGVEWAGARIDAAWMRLPDGSLGGVQGWRAGTGPVPLGFPEAAWTVLGALASGRFGVAERALVTAAGEASRGPTAPLFLLAVGEHGLWTGSGSLLARLHEEVGEACDGFEGEDGPPGSDDAGPGPDQAGANRALRAALWTAGLEALADASEPLADAGRTARLRELARRARGRWSLAVAEPVPGAPRRPPGRLPVVDSRRPGGVHEAAHADRPGRSVPLAEVCLPVALGVSGPEAFAGSRLPRPSTLLEASWLAWAAARAGLPEAALAAWTGPMAGASLEDRWTWPRLLPPATDDDPGQLLEHAPSAGGALAAIAFGLLGLRPDAAYGRIRVAPSVPATWTGFDVSGVRAGEATLAFGYRRDGARHTFLLRPTAGRVPLSVVFAPEIAVRSVRGVWLGGGGGPEQPVDVQHLPRGRRSGVRLQFPLDSDRRVILVGDDDGG